MRQLSSISPPVGRFADALLGADLPGLSIDRRGTTVAFVEQRVSTLPSITRLGVAIISFVVDLAGRAVGFDRVVPLISSRPFPLLAEYPRLVRSLGYAFIWESWPDTTQDGSPS